MATEFSHPHHSEAGWDVRERPCKAGCPPFKPAHPRQLYCHAQECPGPPTPIRRRRGVAGATPRNRSERPAVAEARAVAVKGFLAEVLLGIHDQRRTSGMSIPEALDEYMNAARAGQPDQARIAAVRLCSLVADRFFADAAASAAA